MSGIVAFRIYKCQVREKKARKVDEDLQPAGMSVMDYLTELLADVYKNKKVFIGKPHIMNPDVGILSEKTPKLGDPFFVLLNYRQVGRVVEVEVSFGKYGDRDFIVHADNTYESIRDTAPTKDYLMRIAFPEDSSTFYMVTEIHGKSQAGQGLLDRLAMYDHMRYAQDNVATEADTWLRYACTPIIDEQRLDNLTSNVDVLSMTLVARGLARDGQRESTPVRIFAKVEDIQTKKNLSSTLLDWFKKKNLSRKDGAEAIRELMPAGVLTDDLDCEDGRIEFKENGKTTTISANEVDNIFTYPLPKGSTQVDLWREASDRLDIFSQTEQINIPRVDGLD